MGPGHSRFAAAAVKLASALPGETLELVARLVSESLSPAAAGAKVSEGLANPAQRRLVLGVLDEWRNSAADLSPQAAAMTVLTATFAEQVRRDVQSVELVWTGPGAEAVPFRRTEQALLQVLDSATERITLVSYAVYNIPNIRDALVQAARRGVKIRVIVETPHRLGGENAYDTLKALGPEVAACSAVLYWPKEQRPKTDCGTVAKLHVKCAVADGRRLFLSSANLTEHAFTINMELGLLVSGGDLPRKVEEHFDRIATGKMLEKV